MSCRISRAARSVAAVVFAAAAVGWAQIERLDLAQMVAKTDNAVLGKIVGKEVVRVDSPRDGPELYFTHLLIEGRSLYTGNAITVPVTFAGGSPVACWKSARSWCSLPKLRNTAPRSRFS